MSIQTMLFSDVSKLQDDAYMYLKDDIEFIKELFDPSQKANLKNLENLFLEILKKSQNGFNYYITLFNHFIRMRWSSTDVVLSLVNTMISFFPDEETLIRKNITQHTGYLKFAISKELQKESEDVKQEQLFTILKNDDIDAFISFLSVNPSFNIHEKMRVDHNSYWYIIFDYCIEVYMIDLCCYFGSLKCFRYLLLNKCEITDKTLNWSIAGGNKEIINILKENGHSFEHYLETSISHHQYETGSYQIINPHQFHSYHVLVVLTLKPLFSF